LKLIENPKLKNTNITAASIASITAVVLISLSKLLFAFNDGGADGAWPVMLSLHAPVNADGGNPH